MKSFRGPKGKIVRRFGINIFESRKYDKILDKRPSPPGMHGAKRRRAKMSEYGRQLTEKQKLKFCYGTTEKQFRGYYEKASVRKGPTGVILLQFLELRLDNVVYRAGYATTRAQSKQLVSHSHVLVNGKKVNIPSYIVKPGDVIEFRNKEATKKMTEAYASENNWRDVPGWMKSDKNALKCEIIRIPERTEIPNIADEQLVVELFSK